ncbi:MAG: hypothetical protein H6750_13295 [Nitrospiraceae bacterium]|nr:hypothetical protein [Nitrospira sp.]MCB9775279.1 hypothetical protein [Nitrospiraceae bacterium]
MNAIELLVPVMVMAGILGGLINFFIADPTNEVPLAWWKHVIIGIGAAFTVPVFLNMISSTLIGEIAGQLSDAKILSKLLVFTGFCLLAAISSRNFLRSLSERVLQEVKAAKKQAEEAREEASDAQAAVAPFIEEDIEPVENMSDHASANLSESDITEDELKILKAMTMSRFSIRSLTGLAKDAGIPKEIVNATLGTLLQRGFVSETKNKQGQPRWYATPLGRSKTN